MKKHVLLFALVLLAGCAVGPHDKTLDDLREPEYLRAERELPLSFAQIQMALFKHKAACGSGPEFAADPQRPSYASITQKPSPAAGLDRTIVVDLVLRLDRPVKARAYSYYAGVDKQVQRIFDAITHPAMCS